MKTPSILMGFEGWLKWTLGVRQHIGGWLVGLGGVGAWEWSGGAWVC